ncbi:unnamed protein product [Cunninghamella blakesleeana]
MDTNQFTFLSLTTYHHPYHHPHEEIEQNISTHDSVEWFLYGAEDHSLLTSRPPTTYLKLTPNDEQENQLEHDFEEEDDKDEAYFGSTHEPSSTSTLLLHEKKNKINK